MDVDEVLNKTVKKATDEFYTLKGNTFKEKKKSFNTFLNDVKSGLLSPQEFDDFVRNLNTTTAYDEALKVEFILHFQLNVAILDILKSGKGHLIGKVLKNWIFFKDIFSLVTIEELVNTIFPLMASCTRIKVINRINKTLSDEQTADELFQALESKYGIRTAMIILPSCSIKLIKKHCEKHELKLSNRQLLAIYKRDQAFLSIYFDLLKEKHIDFDENDYLKVYTYVAKTNIRLFWKLFEKYPFRFVFGKHTTAKVFNDKELIMKYATHNNLMFSKKEIEKTVYKAGIQKTYLLSIFPKNVDNFISSILQPTSSIFKYLPKTQRLSLTASLFNEKYSDDLLNYAAHFKSVLKCLTVNDRGIILDKLKDKEEFLYFYNTNKSLPLLKERLVKSSDYKTRHRVFIWLFKTCNLNNDQSSLLSVLKLIFQRYKNDTSILHTFANELGNWKTFDSLTQGHWELINEILNYLDFSNVYIYGKDTIREEYFKFLVKNNNSIDKLVLNLVTESLDVKNYINYDFLIKTPKYQKIYIEAFEKVLRTKKGHKNHENISISILNIAILYDKRNPNELNMLDYKYILDFEYTEWSTQSNNLLYYLKHYNSGYIFNFYIKNTKLDKDFYIYCLENCPEELRNFGNYHDLILKLNPSVQAFLKCPYIVKNHLKDFIEYSLTAVADECRDNKHFPINLIRGYSEDLFVETTTRLDPPADGKIDMEISPLTILLQNSIIKVLPDISCPKNMTLIKKFCKGDYLKFALPSLYKILHNAPEMYVDDFLRELHRSAVSVRKHALILARHLSPTDSFYNLLSAEDGNELNLSMRNVLLKKCLEHYRETNDVKFFDLFKSCLRKIDTADRDIFEYLQSYTKFPRKNLSEYIATIYDCLESNSDNEIRKKRFDFMTATPDYVVDNFDVVFLKRCVQDILLNRNYPTFPVMCIFYTTNDKHREITGYIFEEIKNYFKSFDKTNYAMRSFLVTLIKSICQKTLEKKTFGIFKQFYTLCKSTLPSHSFMRVSMFLSFAHSWYGSKNDVNHFAVQVNHGLLDFVKLYSNSIVKEYCHELKLFLNEVSIDKFKFTENFFNSNSVDATYIATIYLLPNDKMPSEKNFNSNYVPILTSLQKINTPMVTAHLDLYFDCVSCGV